MSRHKAGDIVRMKTHPDIDMVVLGDMRSPARGDVVYKLRFASQPEDMRGFLVWEENLVPR